MNAIATLTLNPALDISTGTDHVRPTHKLRCAAPRMEPGGGGINVARVLHALGADATAVFPSGGPAGATLEALLRDAGVPIAPVPIAGATRESFTVDEAATGQQYRFVLPGPPLDPTERAAVLAALRTLPAPPAYLVASGSLPPGVDGAVFHELAALGRETGARLVIDTSGAALAACEGAHAYLIKPSLRELEDLAGRTLATESEEEAAARDLLARGFAEIVVVSLAERGAVLVSADRVLRLAAIEVPVGSAVGAGDSMTAALVLALARGKCLDEALLFGVAAGAAALLTPGTELVRRDDVERLYAAASGVASAPNNA
ncbi:1-phosphofructokinase family hexose kinase [Sphingomonas hengshuiensis]|uniref:Phosphofructokinase n=1 Tax=Sphingomonas hengshuiensis TaxID=1609977 RepID=A0A7U4J8K2_9SPHN|nr:1-phosphofructokinase family hexose kinase [Sphingomonas hengshuiensis]AJP72246.1 phosphofructokinase [Sphingomonas hengshuiensis]